LPTSPALRRASTVHQPAVRVSGPRRSSPSSRAALSAASGRATGLAHRTGRRGSPDQSQPGNPTSRFGWSGRSRKGCGRGGWRSWHTGFTGRAITSARCGEGPQDFLGYDDSLDHLPQQRWLKMLAGDRALRPSNDLATADGGTCRLGACACFPASWHAASPIWSAFRRDTPLTREAMAPVPPRHRPFARRFARDRPHYRNHDGGERSISRGASRRA